MEITTELLKKVYERSIAYSLAKFNKEPDSVSIDEDGEIEIEFITYCCGDRDVDTNFFAAEDLNSDLDDIYAARKKQEEIDKENRRLERIKKDAEDKVRAERKRKQQYLELKKEFES